MDIVIAGGHGKVAMLLHPILIQRGHRVRGIIRNPDQAEDLREVGAEPIVFDLEQDQDLAGAIGAADGVVFAAGAGPGSGAERKWTVDRDGAIKLIEAARKNDIGRYVMLSAMGVDRPERSENEVYQAYREAKAQADEALRNSGLAYTILRPGGLTNDRATGRIALGGHLEPGEIPRADVAAVLAYALEHPETAAMQLELTSGNLPIAEAFQRVIDGGRSYRISYP